MFIVPDCNKTEQPKVHEERLGTRNLLTRYASSSTSAQERDAEAGEDIELTFEHLLHPKNCKQPIVGRFGLWHSVTRRVQAKKRLAVTAGSWPLEQQLHRKTRDGLALS